MCDEERGFSLEHLSFNAGLLAAMAAADNAFNKFSIIADQMVAAAKYIDKLERERHTGSLSDAKTKWLAEVGRPLSSELAAFERGWKAARNE